MKKVILISVFSLFTLACLAKALILKSTNEMTVKKLNLIKEEVSKMGYHNRWIVISGHRSEWYNSRLSNADKESYHLKGMAIDIYVFDINGNWKFDLEDISILMKANDEVERKNPKLVGAFGTYLSGGYFTKRMIHFDTRGFKRKYNV